MKYDVFISYSRKDLNVVEKFVMDLKERIPNLTYWFDLTGIEPAEEEFDEKIIKAIENSSYVLYFLSPNSMKSKWTKEEVMYAKNCGKKVIPVLLNGATLEGWFLFHFGRVDCIDLSKKEQVEKMIKNLSAWTKKESGVEKLDGGGAEREDTGTTAVQAGVEEGSKVKPEGKESFWSRFVKRFVSYNYKSAIFKVLLYLLSFIIFFFLFLELLSKCDDGTTNSPGVTDSVVSTTELGGTENGHEYVDLGLSVKWATCNVGAYQPEEYGDYFAWGETIPKSTYDWSTYKWCNGSYTSLTKYCTDSDYGTVDNKTQLELSDDAAHANWGGSWRMPTYDELNELKEKCTWTWTTQNGMDGYKVTSKINGRSIFLPAADNLNGSSLYYAGSYGYYWSSSLSADDPYYAMRVYFNSSLVDWYYYYRYYGLSVRPVCP